MPFKIDDPENPGQEKEVYTAEELAAKDTEATTAKTALEAANAEVAKLRTVVAEKTDNFRKLNEMSAEEKAKMTSEQIEDRKRWEAAEARAAALEQSINDDKKARIESDTAAALAKYHGGDEKLKAALEENFKLINLDGTDKETLEKRAKMAADMYKGQTGKPNPLMASMNGGGPVQKDPNKTQEFLKSDRAAEAMRRMGDTPNKADK